MNADMNGKVVVVTGASRGIGRAVALAFAHRGAKVVLAARSADRLAQVEREVRDVGADVLSVATDVTSEASVRSLVAHTMDRFGRIDVLVNNAGIGKVGEVESATFGDDVRQTLQASLFGMISVTRQVLPIMREQGSGAIVNMSSVMGRKAFGRFGSYAIVMHAVAGFSDALRQELTGTGITVSVIHPALTATDLLRDAAEDAMPAPFRHMTPLSPEQVGRAVVRAAQRGTARVVMPWMANTLLWGEALSPRIGDLIARAISLRPVARVLGLSRGTTYHQAIGESRPPEYVRGWRRLRSPRLVDRQLSPVAD
jgi:NAD(P)-dependent dehydrogenase (short-subunit alcohol dehydrogenase family)